MPAVGVLVRMRPRQFTEVILVFNPLMCQSIARNIDHVRLEANKVFFAFVFVLECSTIVEYPCYFRGVGESRSYKAATMPKDADEYNFHQFSWLLICTLSETPAQISF